MNDETLMMIDGLEYKFGRFNYVFMLLQGDWVRSGKEPDEVKREWVARYMRRLKLPPAPKDKACEAEKTMHKKKVKEMKAEHMGKVEDVLGNGEWMETKPHVA